MPTMLSSWVWRAGDAVVAQEVIRPVGKCRRVPPAVVGRPALTRGCQRRMSGWVLAYPVNWDWAATHDQSRRRRRDAANIADVAADATTSPRSWLGDVWRQVPGWCIWV